MSDVLFISPGRSQSLARRPIEMSANRSFVECKPQKLTASLRPVSTLVFQRLVTPLFSVFNPNQEVKKKGRVWMNDGIDGTAQALSLWNTKIRLMEAV